MPSNRGRSSAAILTSADINEVAVRIWEMWDTFNTGRRTALAMGEEARQYVFATDLNSTTAAQQPHKNRTHIPKLTQISDNLQSQYWEATLSSPKFFEFEGNSEADRKKKGIIEAWIRTKLEKKKFRETVGRQLISDYVHYGNAFPDLDHVIEFDDLGELVYSGPNIKRNSPLDMVFNPASPDFQSSPKVLRKLVHIAEVAEWPTSFPLDGFIETAIKKAITARSGPAIQDWVQVLKDRGLAMDGYSTWDEYFRSDMVEVLIYRGDVYDPEEGTTARNRVVYVIDRTHVVRNSLSVAPTGRSGLHHAGWRIRNDNLWAQGPLDNLIGMQYRIDHLENLKADVFDIIAQPVLVIKGENVQEPEDGYAPGANYYVGIDEDVKTLVPDATALNADAQIDNYFRQMEMFAGSPPESQGQRTPGEKTAFEVNRLDANATKTFVDKARNFELMLEELLHETLNLMIKNFDSADFVELTNDLTGETEFQEITLEDVKAFGRFRAVGAKHWSRRNRETVEMRDFQLGPMQDPKVRAHVNGAKLAEFYEKKLGIEDEQIIEEFAGVREDVHIQIIAQQEAQQLQQELQPEDSGAPSDDEGGAEESGAVPAGGPAALEDTELTPGTGEAPTQ